MTAYYNEIDPYAAQWLRNLIQAGHIAPGIVDERSIVDVQPSDLTWFTQCHFFAGIGGWSLAARLAGWPDTRELWTGSCPCQPFSVAGRGEAQADDRHLWPHLFRLVRARRPAALLGEQVAAAVGKDWLDGIASDLEGIGYACGAAVVPACAVDAPHRRERLWFVADAGSERWDGRKDAAARNQHDGQAAGRREGASGPVVCGEVDVADSHKCRTGEEWKQRGGELGRPSRHPWSRHGWADGHDGKARRVEPGIRLLAHGVPARVGKLRAYGNAIVPQVAAEVIAAYMETTP